MCWHKLNNRWPSDHTGISHGFKFGCYHLPSYLGTVNDNDSPGRNGQDGAVQDFEMGFDTQWVLV